jgi:hypothetical protein
MQRERDRTRRRREDDAGGGIYVRERARTTTEDIHVRSHDHRWAYDLDVEVRWPDGEAAFTRRYYLQPGEAIAEVDALPPGEYELRVTRDNEQTEMRRCRIDDTPGHTAVVEVGNGVLSLTEGLNE